MPKVKKKRKVAEDRAATADLKRASRTTVSDVPPAPTSPARPEDMAKKMISSFRFLLTTHVSSHPECKKYAPSIAKYMRNQFVFFGLKAPARRALQKEFLGENKESLKARKTLMEFVRCLWKEEERDFQAFGVDLLAQYREVLLGETEAEFGEAVALAEHCVVTKSWWDTVDALSYPGRTVSHAGKEGGSLLVEPHKLYL